RIARFVLGSQRPRIRTVVGKRTRGYLAVGSIAISAHEIRREWVGCRIGPIPVGHGDGSIDGCKIILELQYHNPMPREERGTTMSPARARHHRVHMHLSVVVVAPQHWIARMKHAWHRLQRKHGVNEATLLGRAQMLHIFANAHWGRSPVFRYDDDCMPQAREMQPLSVPRCGARSDRHVKSSALVWIYAPAIG